MRKPSLRLRPFVSRTAMAAVAAVLAISTGHAPVGAQQVGASRDQTRPGVSVTRLADGRLLIVGGEGTEARASLADPRTGLGVPTANQINMPRAWHTATLLSDGTVLVVGGRYRNRSADIAEIFDPSTETFSFAPITGASPRAAHSATLLTDGRVLVAGGVGNGTQALPTEIWDLRTQTVVEIADGNLGRSGHTATLTADGRVLVTGGTTSEREPASGVLLIDPAGGGLNPTGAAIDPTAPAVAAVIPAQGASNVAVDVHLTLRFSGPMAVESLSKESIQLSGPDGPLATRVIAAEGGRLAFVWPLDHLAEGTTYSINVAGATNAGGTAIMPASATFTTTEPAVSDDSRRDPEEWLPDAAALRGGWRANRPPSPWEKLSPLVARPGVTAISGRVLTLDGRPLPGVTLEIEGVGETESDRTGRFLLTTRAAITGRRVLEIQGATASRPGRQYGFFEYGTNVVPGQTAVLPFTIWMPRLDTRNTVRIPSPTLREVVVTTPYIPGLELHIPPQTVIRGEDGNPITEIGITPIPVDRPPFPLANVDVPVYFTIQPGGAYVRTEGAGSKGAWLVYPNYRGGVAGQRVQFYHYDPAQLGWYVYGLGTVTPNTAQVAPDPTTRLYEFTGAMINCCGFSPPAAGGTPGGQPKADPVDPSTGVFLMQKTDLSLPDIMPLSLTRTYNSGDNLARPFGRGMTHPYAMFLWTALQYQQVDLILPEGGKVHYVRTSSGSGYTDAVFEHSATPTAFYKSTIVWNGNGWDLALKDGTVYVFGNEAPLQAIRDRYGNQTRITWSGVNGYGSGLGNITRVTSPKARWIAFTYDGSNRITQAADNIGRTVGYTYDANGNLSTVTDPENHVTTYTYDASNRMATIKDGRDIVYLTNTYTNGRVSQQTLADPNATYQFTYTVDGSGNITQTDITDPRGHVERLTFNADHYITTDTEAYGTSLARTTTTTRQTGTNLVTAIVDGLSRKTAYTYDTAGHVLSQTQLADTLDPVPTWFTYEPLFFQLATVTDPLNHTWTVEYDSNGRMTGGTDPLTHRTTVAINVTGQLTQVMDPLLHARQFGYTGSDLTSVTDPLGNVQSRFADAAGRVIRTMDPLGRIIWTAFDKLDRVTSVTDPLGGQTAFAYDANSNRLSLTDALTHATAYTYDASDRLETRTDPLTQAASYAYDLKDHLTQLTDRKGHITNYEYDALDRLTQLTFGDQTTLAYTYDAGDRITEIGDSSGGTITRQYDDLDRLTGETTPQGTINYTYDGDGRRSTMTVAGQSAVSYGYDDAHRLTSITQGSSSVTITYDDANRRSTLTLPNGILASYGYDAADQLTSLTYTLGAATLGDLTYTYDAAGSRTSVGGSWARTGLPSTLASATHDAANRIATWGATSFSYDLNGNLTSDGTTTYTWNARNQLAGMVGGSVSASFAYDGDGRRRSKTVGGTTTTFLYDGATFVQELTAGGTPTANLLTGLGIDEVFRRTDSAGARDLLTDALGSTLELADGSGALQTHYTFEPFGATVSSGTTSPNSIQFTGREFDSASVMFFRARYYDSRLQRFTSEDPAGFTSTDGNLHAYTDNAPTNFTDPSGLIKVFLPSWSPCAPPGPGRKDPWWGPIVRSICMQPPLPFPLIAPIPAGLPIIPLIPRFGDPTEPPPGTLWRGKPGSTPGGPDGNFHNPRSGESFRPDLAHPEPIGPHWDYRAPDGQWYRVFPDGRIVPK